MPEVFYEPPRAGEGLVWEPPASYAREKITLPAGAQLEANTILGRILVGAATVAPTAGNTGNGVLTMDADTPLFRSVKIGTYAITCVEAAAGGGVFRVEDPTGAVIGEVAVGASFADGVVFSIAAGSADFVVGDVITVTVAAGSKAYVPFDPEAADGRQIAAAMLWDRVRASLAARRGVAFVRHCILNAHSVIWPDGITADETAAAIADLEKVGILVRE